MRAATHKKGKASFMVPEINGYSLIIITNINIFCDYINFFS